MSRVSVIGWTGEKWNPHLWQPSAGKSYTKPESIAAKILEIREFEVLAPFVGRMSEVVWLKDGKELRFSPDDMEGLLAELCDVGEFSNQPATGGDPAHLFVGINIKPLFMSLAAMAWRNGTRLPLRFWYQTPGLFDIYSDIVPERRLGAPSFDTPADLQNGFGLLSLMEFFGDYAGCPNVALSPQNATEFAYTAQHLASKIGLV